MLNVVICDSSIIYMEEMRTRMQHIIDYNGYNMAITMLTTDTSRVMKYAEEDEGMTLYIMDVVYPEDDLLGVAMAKAIREVNRNAYIVFNTFHEHTIYQVMKGLIRPAGFLIKPIMADDLKTIMGDIYRDYLNLGVDKEDIFHVNIGAAIHKLPYDQIMYFESYQKKIYIHTHNQRIGYYESLTKVKDRLSEQFVRCHRSYIINIDKIKSVSFKDMYVIMENNVQIDISRTHKLALRSKLEAIDQ